MNNDRQCIQAVEPSWPQPCCLLDSPRQMMSHSELTDTQTAMITTADSSDISMQLLW